MCEQETSLTSTMSREQFWTALEVWTRKPHVVNKRLWGTSLLHSFRTSPISALPTWDAYRNSLCLRTLTEDQLKDKDQVLNFLTLKMGLREAKEDEAHTIDIHIIKLLPKVTADPCIYQLVAKNNADDVAFFTEIQNHKIEHNVAPSYPYSFHYGGDKIILRVYDCPSDDKGLKWLQEIVLPQIVKWGQETPADDGKSICSGSLTLIPNEVYYNKYNELKLKYGKEMVKIWPENTDPVKFVYEDVAIASYLLVLWESERQRSKLDRLQSFVDLGCGNGLLVHILSGEGHRGYGIDVRKRKIWDTYPSHVVLQEQTISPSDVHLFPDIDWIIGNHSDELTPWIPVIAARSSYRCNFFVLPCCCYNFNGTKYQRKDSSKSQYTEYLGYVQRLCESCGFNTSVDRLKIPSTKRICLIGTDRTYSVEKFNEMCSTIQGFIGNGKDDQWISDFKPRQATERVRNCTQIDKSLINEIVQIISQQLIQDCKKGDPWNKGRVLEINEVVNLVPAHLLKSLKSECGGLQTLLRNNHQIFQIESGKVQLRYPQTVSEVLGTQRKRKSKKADFSVKKKPCWFHSNHPQGCPLSDEDCSFVHDESDIK